MSAYTDYIDSLSPGHCWHLDGNSTNTGSVSLTTQTPSGYLAGSPITKGATNSCLFNGTNAMDYGDSSYNVGGPWTRRTYSLWGTWDDANYDNLLYNEGAGVRNMSLYFSIGGVPAYIADNDADSNPGQPWSQAIYGPATRQDIPYHMAYTWFGSSTSTYSFIRAFLNGVLLQEKEILNNAGDTPGGQLNAHSGNIELGLGQQIIVSGQTFNVSNARGRLANCAVWDGVNLDDATIYQLFAQGADTIPNPLTLTNVPAGTEVRIYELTALGGTVVQELGGVETSTGGTEVINYDCIISVPARVTLVNVDKRVYQADLDLPREGTTLDAGLLLRDDRWYSNP